MKPFSKFIFGRSGISFNQSPGKKNTTLLANIFFRHFFLLFFFASFQNSWETLVSVGEILRWKGIFWETQLTHKFTKIFSHLVVLPNVGKWKNKVKSKMFIKHPGKATKTNNYIFSIFPFPFWLSFFHCKQDSMGFCLFLDSFSFRSWNRLEANWQGHRAGPREVLSCNVWKHQMQSRYPHEQG